MPRRFTLSLLAAASCGAAVAQTRPAVELSAQQVSALGVGSEAPAGSGSSVAVRYPARVSVPASRQRVVSAPLGGLVEALWVSPGDAVRAGQPLVSLRSPQLQELQRDSMQAASQSELARSVLDREERLHAEGLTSTGRLEASRAAYQQSRTLLDERRRQVALTGTPGESRPGGEMQLRSPIAGVVLEALVVPGQRSEPAAALLRIAALDTLSLELQVPVAEAAQVRIGDAVRSPATEVVGLVVSIGQAVDAATQSVTVRAQFRFAAGQNAGLRPGQLTEALVERPAPGTTRVAASAIVRSGGAPAVFVERGPGRYELQPVELGPTLAGSAAVRGLPAGSRVVVRGTAALLALAKP